MTYLLISGAFALGLLLGALMIAIVIVCSVGDGVLKIFHDETNKIRVRWEAKK